MREYIGENHSDATLLRDALDSIALDDVVVFAPNDQAMGDTALTIIPSSGESHTATIQELAELAPHAARMRQIFARRNGRTDQELSNDVPPEINQAFDAFITKNVGHIATMRHIVKRTAQADLVMRSLDDGNNVFFVPPQLQLSNNEQITVGLNFDIQDMVITRPDLLEEDRSYEMLDGGVGELIRTEYANLQVLVQEQVSQLGIDERNSVACINGHLEATSTFMERLYSVLHVSLVSEMWQHQQNAIDDWQNKHSNFSDIDKLMEIEARINLLFLDIRGQYGVSLDDAPYTRLPVSFAPLPPLLDAFRQLKARVEASGNFLAYHKTPNTMLFSTACRLDFADSIDYHGTYPRQLAEHSDLRVALHLAAQQME